MPQIADWRDVVYNAAGNAACAQSKRAGPILRTRPSMVLRIVNAGGELIHSTSLPGMGRGRRTGVRREKGVFGRLAVLQFLTLLLFVGIHPVSRAAGEELVISLATVPSQQQQQQQHEAFPTSSHRRALADGFNVSVHLQSDRATLLKWKQHWMSYPAQNPNVTELLSGWSHDGSGPCAWQGISCESEGPEGMRVIEVNMAGLAMAGALPVDGYGNLTFCRVLAFSGNQLNGTIPPAIATMPSLQILDISNNLLSGGIPLEFQGLVSHLIALNLSVNGLSDPVGPSLFSSCGALTALNLSYNNIGGNVPNLQNCSSLQLIDFQNNNLTGSIPPQLGNLPLLQTLVLSENRIGRQIPGQLLANCRSLQSLQLSRMALTGGIPGDLGQCAKLEVVNLQSNFLTGPIPPGLGLLKKLSILALGNNSLTGNLPDDLSAATALQYLDLSLNQITGSVPPSYSMLTDLLGFALQQNRLVGTFPIVLTTLNNLTMLDLSHNQFWGSIPSEIAANTALTSLMLAFNNFSGYIPPEIGALTSLQVLDLCNNRLTGSIPPTLSSLTHLLFLQLSYNQLTGIIPPELGNCSSLIWMNFCRNRLTGPIPNSFQSIGSSAAQTLAANQRNLALLPIDMGECGALERWLPGNFEPYSFLIVDLAQQGLKCRLWWNLLLKGALHPAELDTPLAYMQFSNNQLSGPIPPQIGFEGKFSILFLDNNQLTGFIPDILDQIPLYSLNFSHNRIKGSIPTSLGFARHLLVMDVSFNKLSGRLPPSLTDLTFMYKFNVSYNNLSGPVLLTNQFATYSFSVYTGNPYLCYDGTPYGSLAADSKFLRQCGALGPSSSIPHGSSPKSSQTGLNPNEILGISLGCTMFVLFIISVIWLAAIWAGRWRTLRRTTALKDSKFTKMRRDWAMLHSSRDLLRIPVSSFETDLLPKSLAYLDLLIATNSFDEVNIIGSGGFGIVYKAKLVDNSVVAIKKLVQDGADGDREFAAEMLTLGNIRHANLVPFLGYCAFEREKLLVYKYMTNGSLEDWLHDRPGGKEALTWTKRVRIAAGAARGLAFLHHSCAPVIIHRDMKASNILLDDSFFPCVTDFGLARRMYGQDTHVSTIVAGTLGYVPPEYSQTWRSTTKGDVYSFGVVLLELVTGRRPTGPDFLDDDGSGSFLGGNVVEWVRILLAKGRQDEAYDPFIKSHSAAHELLQFLKLGVACAEDSPNNRPTMSDVSVALDRIQLSLSKRSPTRAMIS